MKRTIISIITATLLISLTGCSNNREETYNKINNLESKIDELSSKIDLYQQLNLESYDKDYSTLEIRTGYVANEGDYRETVSSLSKKYQAEGKTVIAKDSYSGNRIFILQAPQRIKNLTSFNTSGYDTIEWGLSDDDLMRLINIANIEHPGDLKKNLNPGEVLIFSTDESEGLSSSGFFWTEPDGTTLYNFCSYDGSGEKYIYDDK